MLAETAVALYVSCGKKFYTYIISRRSSVLREDGIIVCRPNLKVAQLGKRNMPELRTAHVRNDVVSYAIIACNTLQ